MTVRRAGGVVMVLLGILVVAALAVAGLFAVGAREPSSQLASGDGPVWFVALRLADAGGASESVPLSGPAEESVVPWSELLVPGVALHWSSRAEFPVIGPAESYWHAFAVLQGTRDIVDPLDRRRYAELVEDAQILSLTLERPPRIVLGALKLLARSGLASVPPMTETADTFAERTHPESAPSAEGLPTREQMAAILGAPATLAPAMVNWLAYRAEAAYTPGVKVPAASGATLSGAEAYGRYGLVALQTAYRSGAQLIFVGKVDAVVRAPDAGPTQGRWNTIAVMRYPRPSAMLGMEQVPTYRAALQDRAAGLERTVVIASNPEAR
ncbi:MAG TPA: hypothetical protein DCR65_03170 [Gammaproteobacteria bacterium]|nr:hypothetical protein [Gammaproteobacteria bacterium]